APQRKSVPCLLFGAYFSLLVVGALHKMTSKTIVGNYKKKRII
ncbi:unnamed protein product, partial [marine sediment metagenome]